jgi:hypothetical protein
MEMSGLPPTKLHKRRLPPPVLFFQELIAIMFASIAAAFDDWKYVCTDCQDVESYPVPTLWREDNIMIVTIM